MSSENNKVSTCCFDNLLWRESKDNYSDPTEPQVRDNIYYPHYSKECKEEKETIAYKPNECFYESEESGQLPYYEAELVALDGVNEKCQPEYKYENLRSESENIRNNAIFENKKKDARLGYILHPKSTRCSSSLEEIKSCKEEPKKQIELQNQEFKENLAFLPDNHNTENILSLMPINVNPAFNNKCNLENKLHCSKQKGCFNVQTKNNDRVKVIDNTKKKLGKLPGNTNCMDLMILSRDYARDDCQQAQPPEILPLENTNPLPKIPVLQKAKTPKKMECCSPLASWWNPEWTLNTQNHNDWCSSQR